MKTLIGGAVAAALGLIGVVAWWGDFLTVLAGSIPVMLLLGGGLAIYLGFDEMKDTMGKDEGFDSAVISDAEREKYEAEIDELRGKIEKLEKE
jgi:hypothetical protein